VIERRLDIVRAGYDDAGCHNRAQALRWMSEGLGRGLTVTRGARARARASVRLQSPQSRERA